MKAILLGLLLATPLFAADSPAPKPAAPKPAAPEADDSAKPTLDKPAQLAAAKHEMLVMRLRLDEKHPMVVRQRAKIAELQREVREEEANKPKLDAAGQLAVEKRHLATLRERFTDQHPAVIAQQRKIAELEQR